MLAWFKHVDINQKYDIKSDHQQRVDNVAGRSSCWLVDDQLTQPEKLFRLEENEAEPAKGRREALPRCRY